MNAFHVRGVTNDFTTLSPTFTKMVPSRVQVSRIFRSRFSVRASQAMVARDLVMSSLINRCVPFNFLAFRITAVLVLCVVKRTIISRGAERSSVFLPTRWERTKSLVPILTSSLWAANSLTSPSVSSFADSAKPRIRTVLRREYCSRSSQRSSRLTTLTCSSPIWASFLATVSCSDLVRVTASPRSSWAKASVVTGAFESRDEIAASRASISIVVCGSSGVAGGIGLSEYSLPARVRILGRWQMHSQALLPSFTNNPVPRHARSALHQLTNSHYLDFIEFRSSFIVAYRSSENTSNRGDGQSCMTQSFKRWKIFVSKNMCYETVLYTNRLY